MTGDLKIFIVLSRPSKRQEVLSSAQGKSLSPAPMTQYSKQEKFTVSQLLLRKQLSKPDCC